jgi:acetyl-CoA acetyltransferase
MSAATKSRQQFDAAVVGIGATEFSKNSGRSEWRLAMEAVHAALADAGIAPEDVDGLVTFTLDTNPEAHIAQALGARQLRFFSRVHYGGGGACATVLQAALAVQAGIADVVVCYRAFNERSGLRLGSGVLADTQVPTTDALRYAWSTPHGLRTPASWTALVARRYLDAYGLNSEDLGRVAVSARAYAATNPRAHFYQRPLSLAEHQQSRWIAEPLRLFDCCQETDGAQAIVVTRTDRARALRNAPIHVLAAAQGASNQPYSMMPYYEGDLLTVPELGVAARELWRQSGRGPRDVDTAILYDHFTPYVLMQLEELGFCGRGEAACFVKDGGLDIAGQLPTNTHGGQLGEAYLHGMNGIAEAVRQLRGQAVNQVRDAHCALVTAGTGLPTSALLLGREP